jgi:hypothetical protein
MPDFQIPETMRAVVTTGHGGFTNTAEAKTADKATSPRSILTGISQ